MTRARTPTDSRALNRRQFLLGAGAIGATAAFGSFGSKALARSLPAATAGSTVPTLVLVTLYGGNDALNMVCPVENTTYRSLRGSLALDPADTHDVGEGFAFHPAMPLTKSLWDAGRAAVVHGVGFEALDRSHFHCMDVWQSGSEHDATTGWVGRWLDAVGTDPLDAVAVGTDLPLLLRGAKRSAAVVPAGPFDLPGPPDLPSRDLLASQVSVLSAPDPERAPLAALVAASTNDLLTVIDTVSPLLATTAPAGDEGEGDPGGLSAGLATVATLIEADLPSRVYSVALRGFDTHAGQAPIHSGLLGELDTALGAFVERMGGRPVTVAVYSEFGRRVAPNASDGTDHGSGGTMVLAGRVRPGHHGEPPSLDALVNGDLATTTDYRAVFGGLLEGVIGIDAGDVLDGAPAAMSLV